MSLQAPPSPVVAVVERLESLGYAAWLVGGCVRDRLIGRAVNDWDVATDARPEAVLAGFERAIPTGIDHGTVTVVSDGEPIEVTTYRIEQGYSDGRRPDAVRFTDDLSEDLARRDFTVNALAWRLRDGAIRDPYGGRADLAARRIRAVGEPVERFTEDGLRPLRAIRFATVLDFEIEPRTWTAITDTVDTFRQVSAERIQVELVKILTSDRPGWGVDALDRCGLLAECLPAVAALSSAQRAHTVAALERCPAELAVRLAVLLHAVPGSPEAELRALRFSNAIRRRVVAFAALRAVEPIGHDDAGVRALVAQVGAEALPAWLQARIAWGPAEAWRALSARIDALEVLAGPLRPADLALDGRRLMALADLRPSRRVGRLLEWLLYRVWEAPELNTESALVALIPQALEAVPE